MDRIVRVHYGGGVEESMPGGARFTSSMLVKVLAFPHRPSLCEVQIRVKDVLGWNSERLRIKLEGIYDVGQGHSHKVMMQSETKDEWEAYVLAVKESEWKCLKVVAVKHETCNLGGCFDLNACPPDEVFVTPSGGNDVAELCVVGGSSEHLHMEDAEPAKQQYLLSGSVVNEVIHDEMNEESAICATELE